MSSDEETTDELEFSLITPQIVRIHIKEHSQLVSAMMRFQEYYESPHKDIRGQIFTVGYLRSKGLSSTPRINRYEGGVHHDSPWGGFNFPGKVLKPFIHGLFEPLTTEESDIVEALRYRMDEFYIIGTCDSDLDALDHEICHGLYGTDKKYRLAVDKELNKYDLKALKKLIVSWGYVKDPVILQDECHAYISADYEWLCDQYKGTIPKALHTRLRKIKSRYHV